MAYQPKREIARNEKIVVEYMIVFGFCVASFSIALVYLLNGFRFSDGVDGVSILFLG